MYKKFLEHANSLENKSLLKAETLFVAKRDEWFSAFADHFEVICKEIKRLQDEGSFSKISWLEYTMLYTNFINRNYVAEIWIYGDKSYLDKKQIMVAEYDISHLFVTFDELWNDLLIAMKAFPNKVQSQEITAFMLERLPYFYSYLNTIIRFAIQDCVDKKPFTEIVKNDVFTLSSGAYMSSSEHIFKINKNKNVKDIIRWFSESIKIDYTYGDYSNLDFAEQKFIGTDFRYAIFKNSNFTNASFKMSVLTGANFCNASMENCILRKTTLHEADFTNAYLRGANFAKAKARAGMADQNKWDFVGYIPVSFRNADLTGADFRNTDFAGADFRHATLTNTNFKNAILDNAIFSTRDLPLSDEQMSRIIIEEGV